MRKIMFILLPLLALILTAETCSSSAPASSGQTVGEACFPGMTATQMQQAVSGTQIVNAMMVDDFGNLAIAAHPLMKCSVDTAFAYLWDVYSNASLKMKHAIIDKSQAEAAFKRNWR